MYQNKRNALQRARMGTGLTQETLAERSGYSVDSLELVDTQVDRKLLRMVADGKIDEMERPVFDAILEAAGKSAKAYYEMRFAAGKEKT